MKIHSFGSINIDHVYQVPHWVQPGETLASTGYSRVLGGKGANQSIALARAGANVHHIGRYGSGDEWVKDELVSAGVLCEQVAPVEVPTGHAIIQVDPTGENSILLFAGANKSFASKDVANVLSGVNAGDWLLLQNECSCTAEAIELAADKGVRVAFNPSPLDENVKQLPLDRLSLLVLNEVELKQLFPKAPDSQSQLIDFIRKQLPTTEVVVTLGDKGAFWCGTQGSFNVDALRVDVVDTTGAGDTFLGYLLANIILGLPPEECLHQATAAAAIAVQHAGASISIPTRSAVEAFCRAR